MVVLKQCVVLKTIMQLYISMLILIADISQITSIESENASLNLINSRTSKTIPKPNNDTDPPILFPESLSNKSSSVRETPIIKLDDFVNNENQTKIIIKIINTIKKKFGGTKEDTNLPHATTVILNNNDTHHDTNNTSFNLNESTNNNGTVSKLQVKSIKLYNNELSKSTTFIFLVAVALTSLFFYIFLVSLRKHLERKYGDRQLLI